jgi:hypothetical protein
VLISDQARDVVGLIDTLLRLRINLRKNEESLDLQTPHS